MNSKQKDTLNTLKALLNHITLVADDVYYSNYQSIKIPNNPQKASKVFYENEIEPQQEQFRSLTDWLGIEIVRFKKLAPR